MQWLTEINIAHNGTFNVILLKNHPVTLQLNAMASEEFERM